MSKADKLFYEYSFEEAIAEYTKETAKGPLSLIQIRNLAESYEKTGNRDEALLLYKDLFQRDSSFPPFYVNKMLNLDVLASNSEQQAKDFLTAHPDIFAEEVRENALFNYDIRLDEEDPDTQFRIFEIPANSAQLDFAPTFFGDNVLFTSSRSQDSKDTYFPTGESYLDIFLAKVQADGSITNAAPYHVIEESRFHQATPYYSSSLNKLFYIRSNEKNGRLSFDDNGKNALALGVSDFQNKFTFLMRDLSTSFYYPFFDESTQKLFFAAEFDDSYGGTDIYFVYTNNGQIMSAPVNLGPKVNSPANEISPFIFENSLYFASDVFYGFGGMDIYKSDMGDDNFYSTPINMGPSINSPKDEFAFIIRPEGEGLIGYFSSNRDGGLGKDDLYGFRLKKKPGPKTLIFKGQVVKANTEFGISDVTLTVKDETGKVIKEITTNAQGDYQIEIPWKEGISVSCTKPKYSLFSRRFGEEGLKAIKDNNVNIELVYLDDIVMDREDRKVLRLKKFWFDKGQSRITPDIEMELNKVVAAVSQFPNLQLRIEAHTDSRGSNAANSRLSQQRADAIKSYLRAKGVPESTILNSTGYGEERILNNCTNGVYCLDILHRKNERHLIVIENYDVLF
ncbi:MAG: OmpA family protein [Bacteroidia bacterium]|nr:OmpA family protein [Bacteroidia bacterium]